MIVRAALLVPAARLLDQRLPTLERLGVPRDLVLERPLQGSEAVEVLDLDLRARTRSEPIGLRLTLPSIRMRPGLHVGIAMAPMARSSSRSVSP